MSKDRPPERTDTNTLFTAQNAKIDAVENQCSVLKQAIGTMADAVADEIEELKKGLSTDFDSKIKMLGNRIENSALSTEKGQVEQNRLQFELEKLREDVFSRVPQSVTVVEPSQSHLVSTETEHRFNTLKIETKKLFEQMRHIIQS